MATIFLSFYSAPLITSTRGSSRSVVMCSNNHFSLQTRSSQHKNKVYEDGSSGIVCYRDENGEITCEGYDEGPRFHHKSSRFNHNTSINVEIIQLLQRCWLKTDEQTKGN